MLLTSTSINVSGQGTGDGGSITLAAPSVELSNTTLAADATGIGNGGQIDVTASTIIQTVSDDGLRISARGGVASGNGGTINGHAGSVISLTKAAIDASARGASGSGGSIAFDADTGDIAIESDLRANAGDIGNGGAIQVKSVTGGVSISNPTSASSQAAILANSKTDGLGGSIEIDAETDISLDVTKVSANGNGTSDGGTINVRSNSGNVTVKGDLLASALGDSGNGGLVRVLAPNASTIVDGWVHADALGDGRGGSILFDGPGEDSGGKGQTARGVFGGTVVHWNVGYINQKSSIDVSGILNGGLVILGAQGNIFVNGNIDASATSGPAGVIFIQANQSHQGNTPFVIGPGATSNGITGKIVNTGRGTVIPDFLSDKATRSGVIIEDLGTGGIRIPDASVIKVAVSDPVLFQPQVGHALVLSTPRGSLHLDGHLSLNTKNCCANSVALIADNIFFGANAHITANSTNGDAGSIYISTGSINVESATTLVARGKHPTATPAVNNLEPNAGQIKILAAGAITLDTQVEVISGPHFDLRRVSFPLTLHGNNPGSFAIQGSGSLLIDASSTSQAGFITVAASTLSLKVPTTFVANGLKSIDGSTLGKGGHVTITADKLDLLSHASLRASGQTAGFINISILSQVPESLPTAPLTIARTGNSFDIEANGGRQSGSIEPNIKIHSDGNLTVNANALHTFEGATGHSGASVVIQTSRELTLTGAFNANSSQAAGGSFAFEADHFVVTNLSSISAKGKTAGGFITLSETGGLSRLVLKTVLDAAASDLTSLPGSITVITKGDLTLRNRIVSTGPVTINARNLTLLSAGDLPLIDATRGDIKIETSNSVTFGDGTAINSRGGNILVHANKSDGSGARPVNDADSTPNLIIDNETPPIGTVRISPVPGSTAGSLGVTVSGTNNVITARNNRMVELDTNANASKIRFQSNVKLRAVSFSAGIEKPVDVFIANLGSGSITYTGDSIGSLGQDDLKLVRGELLVSAHLPMHFAVGEVSLHLDKDAIVIVEKIGDAVSLKNVSLSKVRCGVPGIECIQLLPGQELTLGSMKRADGIGRRNERTGRLHQYPVQVCEVALATMLHRDHLLRTIQRSEVDEHVRACDSIWKTAAALSIVTASHGPFRVTEE